MLTIFVSGNDTDVGKTHVMGQFAGTLASRGLSVQIVKLVETGMPTDDSLGDADRALALAQKIAPQNASLISAFRLVRYSKPLAPTRAAQLDGETFSIELLKAKLAELPPCDVRLVEGAGGLAVPIDGEGHDWADLAREVADKTLIVVENRLGAICQARFISMYCKGKSVPSPFFWLNQIKEQSADVLASNHIEIPKIGVPILGESLPDGENFSVSGLEKIHPQGNP